MTNIRLATADDIPQMVDLGIEFFKESNFIDGLTVDPVKGAETFGYMIASDDHFVILAFDDERLVGMIIVDSVRYYTVENVSHLFLYYVLPSYRNTRIGLDLLLRAEDVARATGSKRLYCSSTAAVDHDGKMDEKLLKFYKKLGYQELGCFVMKGL